MLRSEVSKYPVIPVPRRSRNKHSVSTDVSRDSIVMDLFYASTGWNEMECRENSGTERSIHESR